jgi:hypothetical protein
MNCMAEFAFHASANERSTDIPSGRAGVFARFREQRQAQDFRICCGATAAPQRENSLVPGTLIAAKLLLRLALLCELLSCLPLRAQHLLSPEEEKPQRDLALIPSVFRLHICWMPEATPGYISLPFSGASPGFARAAWRSSPNPIDRMEAAFYCKILRLSTKCVCRWPRSGTDA